MSNRISLELAVLTLAALSSCGKGLPDASEALAPTIESISAVDVTESRATLVAYVSSGNQVANCGFMLMKSGTSDSLDIKASIDDRIISATVSGLQNGTTYKFAAFAGNGSGLKTVSAQGEFTTLGRYTPNPYTPGSEDGFVDLPDDNFRAWVLWNFDTDKDGKLSTSEASQIGTIELNSDKISSLAGIEGFPNLTKIHAEGSRNEDSGNGSLATLDLSRNTALRTLYVPWNHIASLDLSSNSKLTYVDADYNELKALEVAHLKELTLLQVSHNALDSLDVRGLDKLDELHCDANPMTMIKLDCKILRYIDIHETKIGSLDLSSCPKINNVDCHDCPELRTIILAKGQVVGNITKDEQTIIVYNE